MKINNPIAIGNYVALGTPGSILFTDENKKLGESNTTFYRDPSTGFVGIGTNSPIKPLHIQGDTGTDILIENTGVNSEGGFRVKNDAQEWRYYITSLDEFKLRDVTGGTNPFLISANAPDNSFFVRNNGNIGLNNNFPLAKLHVTTSAITDVGQIIQGVAGQSANLLELEDSTASDLLVVDERGYLGIGLTNPSSPIHVQGKTGVAGLVNVESLDTYTSTTFKAYSDTSWQGNFFAFYRSRGDRNTPTSVVSGDSIFLFDNWAHDGTSFDRVAQMKGDVDGTVSTGIIPIKWSWLTTDTTGTLATRMTLKNNGYVGINTTNPQTTLDVNGVITGDEVVGELYQEGTSLQVADSLTLNTGTYISGSVTDTEQINNVYYQLQEVTGTPGFDVEFNYTLDANPGKLVFKGRYEGNAAHDVVVEAWNYTASTWDSFTGAADDLPSSTSDYELEFDYNDLPGVITDYISGTDSKVRIYHTTSGVATHNLYVDYLVIQKQQLVISTAGTYQTVTGFTAGENNNVTVDATNGTMTITEPGLYSINMNVSFGGSDNNIFQGHLFKNDVKIDKIGTSRKIGASGDVGSSGFGGIMSLVATDVLKIKVTSDVAGGYFAVDNINWNIIRIN